MRNAIIAFAIILLCIHPTLAQGVIYFPIIFKESSMPDTTIGLIFPREATNLVLNPSGEIEGNYTDVGTATASITAINQKYGVKSYHVLTPAPGDGLQVTISAAGAEPHYFTALVKRSGDIDFSFRLGSTTKRAQLLEVIDSSWSLYGVSFTAAESSAATTAQILRYGTAGGTVTLGFWADGLQVEPIALDGKYTTYIDGSQPGCKWLGVPNASVSSRSGDSKAGGVVQDFFKEYGFFLKQVLGAGVVTPEQSIDSYAILPGGELNSEKIPPRTFTLVGDFYGNSEEDLHAKQQALESALDSATYLDNLTRFRFYKTAVQKEISAYYSGGLEGDLPIYYNDLEPGDAQWTKIYTFKMKASIQLTATDPFFYEVGESAVELDTLDSATFRLIAARLPDSGGWSPLGPPDVAGTYTSIYAMAEDDTYLYIGGDFLNFGGIAAADYIVCYNKLTGVYSAMAALNGIVTAIAIAPNGDVYVGGEFTNASGVAAADYLAVWVVGASAFTAVGTPSSGATIIDVFALFFDPYGFLWIGGDFLNWAGIANADYIVYWDGSAYVAPAVGTDGPIRAFAQYGTKLYIGGAIGTIGGVSVNLIASWDGSTYADEGSGLVGGRVNAIAFLNGQLVVGTQSGAYASIRVGTVWIALGGIGMNGTVQSLAVGPDGKLYLGGTFTQAGDLELADRVAIFNGYSFGYLDIDLPGTPSVYSILISKIGVDPVNPRNYSVYIGFDTTGTGTFAGIADTSNDGTYPAFPKIIYSRSGGDGATIQSLKNERTGRQILFDYDLLDGETLTIDLTPKNRKIISSFFVERLDAYLPASDFSIWQLLPGIQEVSTFVSESGSPTVTGYLLWRDTYKSWN